MNIYKRGIALSLAACISLSPILVKAEEPYDESISYMPISAPIEEAKISEYIMFKGKIEEVRNENDQFSILVKNDNTEGLDALVAYVNEDDILLSDKDMEAAKNDKLEVGMEVSIFYHKDTMMAMSYPPMLGPDVVVINELDENDEFISVMVSKFDEDLLNAEGDMIIRPSDNTVIVDKDGNKVEKDDLADKDLIVFFDIVMTSYPGQTSPKKIVVMPEREDQIIEEEPVEEELLAKFTLEKDFSKEIEGVTMIPLRVVGESLGYEVSWNQETKRVELLRGAQWTAVSIGKDNYSFAKMLIKLGTAPVLVDSTTYVPLSFAEEVLKAKVEMMDSGDINILY